MTDKKGNRAFLLSGHLTARDCTKTTHQKPDLLRNEYVHPPEGITTVELIPALDEILLAQQFFRIMSAPGLDPLFPEADPT